MSPRLSISSRDGGRVVHACDDDRAAGHRGTGDGDLAAEVAPHRAASFRSREQYTSAPFQRLLADHGITCSMSRAATSGTMR